MESLVHAAWFLLILVGVVLTAVVVENVYWRDRDAKKMNGLREVLANFSLGASYKLMDGLAVAIYVYFLYDIVAGYGPQLDIGKSWYAFAIIYIMVDLGFYVTHLVMHLVRWFWAGHVTHHSSDRYNFSVALRQNFTVVLNGALLIWWLPMALIGFDKELVLLAMEVNLLYQFLLHTEMPSPLDRFGAVLNTPSHHRVHHGSNPAQIDRNFGGTFIVWDRLFGTFRSESDAGTLAYGLTRQQPMGYNPLTLLFHEWRDMIADTFVRRDFGVLYHRPGWVSEHPDDAELTNLTGRAIFRFAALVNLGAGLALLAAGAVIAQWMQLIPTLATPTALGATGLLVLAFAGMFWVTSLDPGRHPVLIGLAILAKLSVAVICAILWAMSLANMAILIPALADLALAWGFVQVGRSYR